MLYNLIPIINVIRSRPYRISCNILNNWNIEFVTAIKHYTHDIKMTFLIVSQQSLLLLPLTIFKTASQTLCMTLFLYVIVDSWYAWFANSFLLCYNNDILFVCNKKCFCLLDNTKINNDNMSVILIVNVEITSMAFQLIRYNYAMYTEYALMFSLVTRLAIPTFIIK